MIVKMILIALVIYVLLEIARYVIKKASQGEPLIPDKIKEDDFLEERLQRRARPGLAAPLPDEKTINTPIKVIISFDEKGEKFLNLDIIMIRRSLESIAKSLKEISERK